MLSLESGLVLIPMGKKFLPSVKLINHLSNSLLLLKIKVLVIVRSFLMILNLKKSKNKNSKSLNPLI